MIVESGKLVYRLTGMPINTSEDCKWIFVLSTSRALYVGQKKKGVFQHSSFLSGGATTAAGRLVAQDGVLEVHILPCHKQTLVVYFVIASLNFSELIYSSSSGNMAI